jgi:Rad3-related DNA helicase
MLPKTFLTKTDGGEKMNGKTKTLIALAFIIGLSATVLYAVPIMAYQNGTLDQDRQRDRDRERDHERLCLQSQNGTCENVDCQQNRYTNQLRHEECTENMGSMQMSMRMLGNGNATNNRCQKQERPKMGH